MEFRGMTDITFLDGGLGQEINNRSTQDSAHPLWSVKVMFEEPDIVIATHKDFIRAGARVIDLYYYAVDSDYRDKVHKITGKLPVYFLTGEYDFACTP